MVVTLVSAAIILLWMILYPVAIVLRFEPKRITLKANAVPIVFCFSSPAKHRKLNEAKEARALHRSVIDDLLEVAKKPHSSMETEPATRDIIYVRMWLLAMAYINTLQNVYNFTFWQDINTKFEFEKGSRDRNKM